MKAVIICNGTIESYEYYMAHISGADFVISVDGGASHTRRFNIRPDLLIGDFDSVTEDDFSHFISMGVETVQFPIQKDMTDTELAINTALERGCTDIVIIGGLGSRLDHSLANILLLKQIRDKGARGTVINEYNEITLIDSHIKLYSEDGMKLTLLPLTQRVDGVTTKGLYYPLENAVIELGSTWGVSNEFAGKTAEVSVKSGLLLVIKSRD